MNYAPQNQQFMGGYEGAGDGRQPYHPAQPYKVGVPPPQAAPPPGPQLGQTLGQQMAPPTAPPMSQQWWPGPDQASQPDTPQQSPGAPPMTPNQQRQLRSHQHHMSLPPVYYANQGLSPSPLVQPPAGAVPSNAAMPQQSGPHQLGMPSMNWGIVPQGTPQIGAPISQVPPGPQGPAGTNALPLQAQQQVGSALPGQAQFRRSYHQFPQVQPSPSQLSHATHISTPSGPPMTSPSGGAVQPPVMHIPYVAAAGPTHTPTTGSPQQTVNQVLPRLNRVQSWSQLKPVVVQNPKNRRAVPEGGFMSPLVALTTYLPSTYSICDPAFQYNEAKNPRRVLTEPHEGKLNNGYDNADSDYILYVNDILGNDENRRYLALNLLGKGTFGQVVKCQNMATKEVVAVKVIKNKPAFLNQSMMEVSILEYIQQSVDKNDKHNLLRLKDKFMHKDHLCLVFELLSSNLYDVIKKNHFRGLDINIVRVFAQQLLDSLSVLKGARLIHCDLKPENILLKRNDNTDIKIIDFGSACHEKQTVYTYIQSRFYRSPEVILGLPYTSAIDMWSLGCIIAELFLGLPIFPGLSEYNQWSRIVDSLGLPPTWMLDMGKNTANFMVKTPQGMWRLRTLEEQNAMFNSDEKESKKYFASPDIHETIMAYPLSRPNMAKAEVDEEMRQREALSDFVRGLLNFNPFERWTPQQAAMHPFISRQRFVGPFSPQAADPLNGVIHAPSRYRTAQALAKAQTQAQAQAQVQAQAQAQAQVQAMSQGQVMAQARNAPSAQTANAAAAISHLGGNTAASQGRHGSGVPFPGAAPQPPSMSGQSLKSRPMVSALMPQPLRGRSATIGQVTNSVPMPIQQAAARVDPNDVIRGQNSPAYFPPRDYFPGV